MQREQIMTLLAEAAQAADLRCGCLLDHKDLRMMVGRLATAVELLMKQNDQLNDRLTRGGASGGGFGRRISGAANPFTEVPPTYRH